MLIRWVLYLVVSYLAVGTLIYVWGHPRRKRRSNEDETSVHRGFFFRQAAHSVQTVNFMFHKAIPKQNSGASIAELYATAVATAFDPSTQQFITTGAPHSRAYYLRNFAWFYPTLLDPAAIVSNEDRQNRTALLSSSLTTIIKSMNSIPYTTTLVPLGTKTFAAVNYVTPPSDSLLGILAGLEQLGSAAMPIINAHRTELRWQVDHFASQLKPFELDGELNNMKFLLLDGYENRSSSTDTRRERMRFVVNANAWATFKKALALGIISAPELTYALGGRTLERYKSELLEAFGRHGFIQNCLEGDVTNPARNITLDFTHVHNGFWDFSSPREIELFKSTANIILSNPRFRDASGKCYFVSIENPKGGFIHRYTTAAYHGRTVWVTFNVEFADRLLSLADATGTDAYRNAGRAILEQIETYIKHHGGYPESLNENGELYRTWIYRSAIANSWFPRFISVRSRLSDIPQTTLA